MPCRLTGRTSFVVPALACWLGAWSSSPVLLAQDARGNPRVLQGPVVGGVTPTEIPVWVRVSGPYDCQVEYSTDSRLRDARRTEVQRAEKSRDYTVVLRMSALQPATKYYYRVLVDGAADVYFRSMPPFHTRTAPDGPARFRVAFGSCARVAEDPYQPIWHVFPLWEPDLMFWLGDNVYGDTLDADVIAEEYRRQRQVPASFHHLYSIPQLAIWDDHDFGLNNHDRTNPIKASALEVFRRYWPNPAFGLDTAPGVFFQYHYGGVDFFFLDGRYHRDPNALADGPEKSMLGATQRAWLLAGVQASRAPFKVVVSGSSFSHSKGPHGDAWSAFLHERDGLFRFLRDQAVSGVVLLAGDTHQGELNAYPCSEEGGYDLYEFVSSPLAQRTSPVRSNRQAELRIRRVYNESSNVGILEFDLTAAPLLRFDLVDTAGRSVWGTFELSASDLVNGQATWREKQKD